MYCGRAARPSRWWKIHLRVSQARQVLALLLAARPGPLLKGGGEEWASDTGARLPPCEGGGVSAFYATKTCPRPVSQWGVVLALSPAW